MIRLTRLLIAALAVFLLGLSADNAFAQQEQTRAAKGDTVRVLLNHVKPDKVEDFERFMYEVLKPAIAKHKPEWLTNVRFLHPAAQNEDSTYTSDHPNSRSPHHDDTNHRHSRSNPYCR